MKTYQAVLLVIILIVIDQATKFWVKTNMFLEQDIELTGWLSIHFTENRGMAFGMALPGVWGKLFLSTFRLIAVGGGVWFVRHLIKQNGHWGFVAASSMILAGAIGNMIDGTFYGLVFSDSHYRVAEFLPADGGYAGLMQGLVVDMVHVKLFTFNLPQWVPSVGGNTYDFFPYIFNVADAAITIGVFVLLIFQGVFFKEEDKLQEVLAD